MSRYKSRFRLVFQSCVIRLVGFRYPALHACVPASNKERVSTIVAADFGGVLVVISVMVTFEHIFASEHVERQPKTT